MFDVLTHGTPALWFLNRSTGVVLLLLLTASLVLGISGAGRSAGGLLPAFVVQRLHRNLSLLALALTAVHVTTAVVDEYVDIRWWQAFSPVGATYRPPWVALGAIATDVMLLVALSTWARRRLGNRGWHRIHLLGYLVWPTALAHAAGIGTDATGESGRLVGAACVGLVACAAVARGARGRTRPKVGVAR